MYFFKNIKLVNFYCNGIFKASIIHHSNPKKCIIVWEYCNDLYLQSPFIIRYIMAMGATFKNTKTVAYIENGIIRNLESKFPVKDRH